MCEILNQNFSFVFILERPEGLMELENRLYQEKIESNLNKVLITEEIVYNKLYSLKSNKAHGDHGIGSLMLNPQDVGRRYTGFAETSLWRRTPVYRLCANFSVASEAGILATRYVNARRRTPVYRLCFLQRTGTALPESQRYRQDNS